MAAAPARLLRALAPPRVSRLAFRVSRHSPPASPPPPRPSPSGTTVTKEVIAAGTRLKVIGRAGVGVDNVDIAEATRRGILVMNVPGGNTRSAAELTMSLIMALARNLPAAVSSMKAGKWERARFMGSELSGKVIGVVGLGRIGREVAKWCQAFGMTTIGFDPVMSPDVAQRAGITPVTLDELFARSDYITLHTPKTAETTNLVCAATLARAKAGVRIVNVARGGIVNEADLLAALNSGKVAGAALDVFSSEPPPEAAAALLAHPAVICTPHLGASTNEAQLNVAHDIAVQMADALENKSFVGERLSSREPPRLLLPPRARARRRRPTTSLPLPPPSQAWSTPPTCPSSRGPTWPPTRPSRSGWARCRRS